MSHLALYRAWRPQSFTDVVGQEDVVDALQQSVKNRDFAHAFLFCGSRGTGKTSVAKILAKAVNCEQPIDGNPCRECAICQAAEDGSLMDIVEMDAASHNSVDNIRQLTEDLHYLPAKAKYKVYIIDEVHMLSTGAFNALLKTLEEPPEHVIFILATTEVQRIPETITSRCQRYDFRRLGRVEIAGRLSKISKIEKIKISDAALDQIASLADGSLRDAISLLDQASASGSEEIQVERILALTGLIAYDFMAELTTALAAGQLARLLELSRELDSSGRDLASFVNEWAGFLRDILIAKLDKSGKLLAERSRELQKTASQLANLLPAEQLLELVPEIAGLYPELRYAGNKSAILDVSLIALSKKYARDLNYEEAELGAAEPEARAGLEAETVVEEFEPEIDELEIEEPVAARVENEAAEPVSSRDFEIPPDNQVEYTAANELDTEQEARAEAKIEVEAVAEPKAKLETETTVDSTAEPAQDPEPMPILEQAAENIELSPADDLSPEAAERVWQGALKELQRLPRIDLQMLLSSAKVTYENGSFQVLYGAPEEALYQAITRRDNQEVIRRALETSRGAACGLEFKLGQSNSGENFNPDEPEWAQKIRKLAQENKIEVQAE
ncbi:MAG: DNA polymerase III subunit gamma/tau [Eubacteriales bacterium]|nr:DNA polymerase III subunit gamma/tau [Eubacteriales bacterium]